jgi:superfamily II DNA/RNA helicase
MPLGDYVEACPSSPLIGPPHAQKKGSAQSLAKNEPNFQDRTMSDDEEHSVADDAESVSSVAEGDAETSFARSSFGLSRQLIANLERHGLNVPTEVQAQVIPRIRDPRGRDLCVNAPTGSGKTLAYALPITEVQLFQNVS